MKRLYLVCNAHLDPMWYWSIPEGIGAALSTFRSAADICEEFDGFIFNHNESILYKWIEEYEPDLFMRIKKLIKAGKWKIAGGWFLQPECNMLSGESFVRQILVGRKYFMEKFGCFPKTAVNFDSSGHTRGLVQILKKSGYEAYFFMRPEKEIFDLPDDDFIWVGLDGSEIPAHRFNTPYYSMYNKAAEKIADYIESDLFNESESGVIPWGVGNHGGGPSRQDLRNIAKLHDKYKFCSIMHASLDDYMTDTKSSELHLSRVTESLNHEFTGSYTSQARLKRSYREFESQMYLTEKIAAHANMRGLIPYPENELYDALNDLLLSQSHDIIMGNNPKQYEHEGIRIIQKGCETLSQIQSKAFIAMANAEKRADDDTIPILVYNPHPYEYEDIIDCEFMLPKQDFPMEKTTAKVFCKETPLNVQHERIVPFVNLGWRKRVVFNAVLKPMQINYFHVKLEQKPENTDSKITKSLVGNDVIEFVNDKQKIVINCRTGLVDEFSIDSFNFLEKDSFGLCILEDGDDTWRVDKQSFDRDYIKMNLSTKEDSAKISGLSAKTADSIRIIEDGDIRTVVEAVFNYNSTYACVTYRIPKKGTGLNINIKVFWNEKGKMLKFRIPTALKNGNYLGQTAFGYQELPKNGEEAISQKWTAVTGDNKAFSVINNTSYGTDFYNGEVRLSLVRSPVYCAYPVEDMPFIPDDRFIERMDQGEHIFDFQFNAGDLNERMLNIEKEACIFNEPPAVLSYFPAGKGKKAEAPVIIKDSCIIMSALKKAENNESYLLRLYEATGNKRSTYISLPIINKDFSLDFNPFEVRSFILDIEKGTLTETDLMENILK